MFGLYQLSWMLQTGLVHCHCSLSICILYTEFGIFFKAGDDRLSSMPSTVFLPAEFFFFLVSNTQLLWWHFMVLQSTFVHFILLQKLSRHPQVRDVFLQFASIKSKARG
jgi:hypothetical protein